MNYGTLTEAKNKLTQDQIFAIADVIVLGMLEQQLGALHSMLKEDKVSIEKTIQKYKRYLEGGFNEVQQKYTKNM